MQQTRPSPQLDSGIRLDPNGNACFRHEGFNVWVNVADRDDATTDEAHPVMITAEFEECGVMLAKSSEPADFGNPYDMQRTVQLVVTEVVRKGRRMVEELVKRLAEVEEREARRKAREAAETAQ